MPDFESMFEDEWEEHLRKVDAREEIMDERYDNYYHFLEDHIDTIAYEYEQERQLPNCPRCGSKMIRRTARKGRNAGNDFWGCRSFPKCRGSRSL